MLQLLKIKDSVHRCFSSHRPQPTISSAASIKSLLKEQVPSMTSPISNAQDASITQVPSTRTIAGIVKKEHNGYDDSDYKSADEGVPITPSDMTPASIQSNKAPASTKVVSTNTIVKRRKTSKDGAYRAGDDSNQSEDSDFEFQVSSKIIRTPRNASSANKNLKDEGYATQSTARPKLQSNLGSISSFDDAISIERSSPLLQPSTSQRKLNGIAKPSPRKPIANYTPALKKSQKRSASDVDDDEEGAQIQARLQAEMKAAESSRAKDHQAVLDANNHELERKRLSGWHPQELEVLERLGYRGYEPLMHLRWSHDFPTFPQVLFTTVEDDTTINTFSENEFRGIKALESLVSLGARVRSNWRLNKPTALMMKRTIESYIHHTDVDAGYSSKRFVPSIIVIAGPFTGYDVMTIEQANALAARSNKQLHNLAARHRAALALPLPHHINEIGQPELYKRAPPVVFSIVCTETKVYFNSLDASITDTTIEAHAMTAFDFAQLGADVWNGIAVALLCINVRNATHEFSEDLKDIEHVADDTDA